MDKLGHKDIDEMFEKKQHVDWLLRDQSQVIQKKYLYLNPKTNKKQINRLITSADIGKTHQTCTAFCLYYLIEAGLISLPGVGKQEVVLDLGTTTELITTVGETIKENHINDTFEKNPKDINTETVPNQYFSPICVAGYLRACSRLKLDPDREVLTACGRAIAFLRFHAKENGGYVPQLGSNAPSSYLTYWSVAALHEYHLVNKNDEDGVLLNKMTAWLEGELTSQIAYHHTQSLSRFDIIEMVYAAIGCLQFPYGNRSEREKFSRSALGLVFDSHFNNGVFGPSAPVFADKYAFSFRCPTVEAMALVLLSKGQILIDRWKQLIQIQTWLGQNIHNGWYSEWDGRNMTATAYTTVSALTFLRSLSNLLDDELSNQAKRILGITPYVEKSSLAKFQYPASVREVLNVHVIQPLKNENDRDLASYSMILYGPPGTSKTTIAEKLAQDLGWPFKAITQSEFLVGGLNNLDAEASKIFGLVEKLKDVVILFDEIEELVQDRSVTAEKASRLLTTAMLPRIHALRDRSRIVFIFATNYVKGLDSAAVRLGRFDIIRCVMPPDPAERQSILDRLLVATSSVDQKIQQIFSAENVVKKTENFGFKDIQALVNRMRIELRVRGGELSTELVGEAIAVGKRAVNERLIQEFKKSSNSFDRP